jgi:hypothetical protein
MSRYCADEYNGDWRQNTSLFGHKRLKKDIIETRQEKTKSSVHILDLPTEMLARILHFSSTTYKDMAALRAVCHKFNAVCGMELLSAFYRIQVRPRAQQA